MCLFVVVVVVVFGEEEVLGGGGSGRVCVLCEKNLTDSTASVLKK